MNLTELKQFITLAEFYIWVNLMLTFLTVIGFILYAWFLYREHRPVKPTNERLEQRLNWLDVDIASRHNLVNSKTAILQKQIDIIKTNIDKINENLNNLSTRRTSNKTTGKRHM